MSAVHSTSAAPSVDSAQHGGAVCSQIDNIQIIECAICGFRHVWPLPDAKATEAFYRDQFYTTEKPDYFRHYEADRDWWWMTYHDRLAQIESLIVTPGRRLLDIGSGPGFFLQVAQERGWQVLGIEPSPQAAAYASTAGVEVINDFFPARGRNLGQFDAIHLSEVLEHVPDPAMILREVYGALTAGGNVCISVPNDYNPFQMALQRQGMRPWWVNPGHHLNYFDAPSLKRLVERSGLRVIRQEASFPIDMFLMMGENYVDDPELGRACHKLRQTLELNMAAAGLQALRHSWYQSMAELGLGRLVVLYATKD
jgi:SAM-dependent methyltransferase